MILLNMIFICFTTRIVCQFIYLFSWNYYLFVNEGDRKRQIVNYVEYGVQYILYNVHYIYYQQVLHNLYKIYKYRFSRVYFVLFIQCNLILKHYYNLRKSINLKSYQYLQVYNINIQYKYMHEKLMFKKKIYA